MKKVIRRQPDGQYRLVESWTPPYGVQHVKIVMQGTAAEVAKATGRALHLPNDCATNWREDRTLCGSPVASSLVEEERGIEAITCRRCQRIYDGC